MVTAISRSNHALSIELANDTVVTLDFNSKTRGIDRAFKGARIIVTCKLSNGRLLATSIKNELSGLAAGVEEISVKEVNKLVSDREEFTLVDARSRSHYTKSHLPTAVSIPACELKRNLAQLPEDKGQLLVFYCGGKTCGISTFASAAAARAGYKNIKVMLGGIEGWSASGYPTYAEDEFILQGDALVIDLRPARKNTVGRIPGSVSIPFETLAGRMAEVSQKAPVVVYSDKHKESLAALNSFRSAGYTTAAMVQGNYKGWTKRNRTVDSGPVVSRITWSRKIGKGEVSPALFNKAVNSQSNTVIVDVRTGEETSAGSMKGAKLLPLNELFDRLEELPRGRKIYVYSSTGARAEMAARLLLDNGFDAYFLKSDISCRGGKCQLVF